MPAKHPPSRDLERLRLQAVELGGKFAAAARRAGQRPWTREEIAQGFVVDVGDLVRLVMAKAGRRQVAHVDRKLGHELADCLWSVLVLADRYGVNLESEFEKMIASVGRKLARRNPVRHGRRSRPTL
ncbi:MAG TPA: MazG nucleotide pyrophosphohydrolase domain-containing protein [Candidatus Didemnitutus sp.]|jgi:NTP pyrophosphatase (non-canonical NTP hydrolase)